MSVPDDYVLEFATPAVDDFLRLRRETGLTPRSRAAAEAGLPNSFLAVTITQQESGEVVGMGRVVGDGALNFQLDDIAVLPEHQGRGIGYAIVEALMNALKSCIDAEAYVSLIADDEAPKLYAKFGFEDVAPRSIGMAQWLRPEED